MQIDNTLNIVNGVGTSSYTANSAVPETVKTKSTSPTLPADEVTLSPEAQAIVAGSAVKDAAPKGMTAEETAAASKAAMAAAFASVNYKTVAAYGSPVFDIAANLDIETPRPVKDDDWREGFFVPLILKSDAPDGSLLMIDGGGVVNNTEDGRKMIQNWRERLGDKPLNVKNVRELQDPNPIDRTLNDAYYGLVLAVDNMERNTQSVNVAVNLSPSDKAEFLANTKASVVRQLNDVKQKLDSAGLTEYAQEVFAKRSEQFDSTKIDMNAIFAKFGLG